MALIAIASDKGAPGVTTAALALAAVWPRPVLLAECDQAGGDLVYRFPAAGGGHLDPRRGVLSLAVVARRGMQPHQVWEHVQKLHGGLDVLAGVTNAEQGAGLSLLWGPIGKALAALPQADVIADCGRLGADGPLYDLLVEATTVVLVSKVQVADVIRLRDRASAFAAAAQTRGRRGFGVGVVVVAEHKKFRAALGEVQHVLGQANAPATVLGGIAHDTKGADLLGGEWGGSLDRTMLIKTAREVAAQLVQSLPPIGDPAEAPPGYPAGAYAGPQAPAAPAAAFSAPQSAAASYNGQQLSGHQVNAPQLSGPQPPRPAGPWQIGQERGRQEPAWSEPGRQEPGRHETGRHETGRHETGRPQPVPAATPDLAAVTLSAPPLSAPPVSGATVSGATVSGPTVPGPTISADAPRTTFSRVLGGRGGRHQADPAQAGHAQAGHAQAGHAQAGHAQAGHAQASHAQAGRPQAGYGQASGSADQPAAAASQPGLPGTERSAAYTVTQTGTTQPRGARHAAPAGVRPGGPGSPGFSRPPMPPLTPSASPGNPADAGNQDADSAEDSGWGRAPAEDSSWDSAPWQRQGPIGPVGSATPGGE